MTVFDRYTDTFIKEKDLPDSIELGRFAIVNGVAYNELTGRTYKPVEGQRIVQELLDPVNRDKHEVLQLISEELELNQFASKPLIQGIKKGLEFGHFAEELEEKMFHIEAIFHSPHTKLKRSVEKVPVSKAKRISNRSNQYLAAHTEDWLHKSLVSFHPSRILTEEIIIDDDIYENQLLIAFVTRAAQHLERRLTNLRDISEFLKQYHDLMEKYNSASGWYKKVRRELELAGKVYDEDSGNYRGGNSELEIISRTDKRLQRLRDSLLKLRQYDLFYTVDQRKVNSVQYHDTNVLVNHKHYRYLKDLWHSLNKEEQSTNVEDKIKVDDSIISNLRDYCISIINYAVTNVEYLGYKANGTDRKWKAVRDHNPEIQLSVSNYGVVELMVGSRNLKFVIVGSVPTVSNISHLPVDTYVLYYDSSNSDNESIAKFKQVIPVSLKDVESVERIAVVIRETMLKLFLEDTLFSQTHISNRILQFKPEISRWIPTISIDEITSGYMFIKHPSSNVDFTSFLNDVVNNEYYKSKSRMEQNALRTELEIFIDEYRSKAETLSENLRCFALSCSSKLEQWYCENLNYLECPCGAVLDTNDKSRVLFFHKGVSFSKDEMGMDFLELLMID